MSSHEKIIYIDLNIFPDFSTAIVHGALLPLITSMLLIFVYPIPAEFIYKHVKINQRRLKEIQQSIDDESPLSKEQARKIRREALEGQLKYEAEIDSKSSENARLKQLISELQQELDKAKVSPAEDEGLAETPNDSQSDAELLSDHDNNFVAAYTAAKDGAEFDDVKVNTENASHNPNIKELDSFVRKSLLKHIDTLDKYFGVSYDVSAAEGTVKVLLKRSDGTFFPYITNEYTPENAIKIIEDTKHMLDIDFPPRLDDSILTKGIRFSGSDLLNARKLILQGLAAKKHHSDIRRELIRQGYNSDLIDVVMSDIKRSGITPP
jgi:hypothetical protein